MRDWVPPLIMVWDTWYPTHDAGSMTHNTFLLSLYRCCYLHTLRESVSPICMIFSFFIFFLLLCLFFYQGNYWKKELALRSFNNIPILVFIYSSAAGAWGWPYYPVFLIKYICFRTLLIMWFILNTFKSCSLQFISTI